MGGELSLHCAAGRGCHFKFELLASEVDAPLPAAPVSEGGDAPLPVPSVPSVVSTSLGTLPTDDALARLRQLAGDGQWSAIEDWLTQISTSQPQCANFLVAVREALSALDFDGIQRMATPSSPALST